MLSILAFSLTAQCGYPSFIRYDASVSGFYSWHVILFLGRVDGVRIVIADCSVDYEGRLRAHLPRATRLLMVKNDGSVLIHSDGGSYKPLNWMSPPCSLLVADYDEIPESTREDLDTDVQSLGLGRDKLQSRSGLNSAKVVDSQFVTALNYANVN